MDNYSSFEPGYKGANLRHGFKRDGEPGVVDFYNGHVLNKLSGTQTKGKWSVKFEDEKDKKTYQFEPELIRRGIKRHQEHMRLKLQAQQAAVNLHGTLPVTTKVLELIHQYKDSCNADDSGAPVGSIMERDEAAAKLLVLHEKHKLPLKVWEDIVSWAEQLAPEAKAFNSGQFPSRKKILDVMTKRYNMTSVHPEYLDVFLPNSKKTETAVLFDPCGQIASWFTDPSLMKDENFEFPDKNDPFAPPTPWNEINRQHHPVDAPVHGRWYSQTYHARITVGEKKILVGFILGIDETHKDNYGHLKMEPVMCTLTIFSQKIRCDPKYIRYLGFIPTLNDPYYNNKPTQRLSDYHVLLGAVLGKLKELQQHEGVAIEFPYQGQLIEAVFVMPVACIVGDHKGQNMLCGKKSGCSTSHLCRRCDLPKHLSSEPRIGNLIKAQEINAWVVAGHIHKVSQIAHHVLTHGNGCTGLDLGIRNPRGINWATFVDVMHTLCRGLMDYIRENFLCESVADRKNLQNFIADTKRLFSNRRNARERSTFRDAQKDDPPTSLRSDDESSEEEEEADVPKERPSKRQKQNSHNKTLKANGVISGKLGKLVDKAAKFWGKALQHQSDRDIGKIHFTKGIAKGKSSKFKCNEMPGVLLLYVILLSSGIGNQFFETPDNENQLSSKIESGKRLFKMESRRTADYIWAFEEVILLYEMLRSGVMTVAFVQDYLSEYITLFMERWKNCLPRDKGFAWGFLKFHSLMHFPEMLVDMGNATTFDSYVFESVHKTVKWLADRTSKTSHTFLGQIGKGLGNHTVVERTAMDFGQNYTKAASSQTSNTIHIKSVQYIFNNDCKLFSNKLHSNNLGWHDPALQGQVESFLALVFGKQSGAVNRNGIYHFCAEAKIRGVLYRAHPAYHTTNGLTRGWHDFAMVSRYSTRRKAGQKTLPNTFPVQLIGFVKVHRLPSPYWIKDVHTPEPYRRGGKECLSVQEQSVFAIVRYLEPSYNDALPHFQSRLLSHGKMKNGIFLVSVTDIQKPCIAIPDLEAQEKKEDEQKRETYYDIEPTHDKDYIFVLPRSEWASFYRDMIIKEMNALRDFDELASSAGE
jgi:hypothetical protein